MTSLSHNWFSGWSMIGAYRPIPINCEHYHSLEFYEHGSNLRIYLVFFVISDSFMRLTPLEIPCSLAHEALLNSSPLNMECKNFSII